MKKTLKNEKRWDEKNIRRAARVFLKAEKEKGALIRLLDDAVHWLAFLLVIFACIIVDFFLSISSIFLAPLLIYGMAVALGIMFGWLIEMPLMEIEKLDRDKHFLLRVALPMLAVLNIYLLSGVKWAVALFGNTNVPMNPFLVGMTYGAALIIPGLAISGIGHFRKIPLKIR
ncbi:hypothetical protein J4401_03960 [Candidatus Woesearchaeota archaeon]|nr:hypothetical protein [Candidatus Woesearchaeota archaeon]